MRVQAAGTRCTCGTRTTRAAPGRRCIDSSTWSIRAASPARPAPPQVCGYTHKFEHTWRSAPPQQEYAHLGLKAHQGAVRASCRACDYAELWCDGAGAPMQQGAQSSAYPVIQHPGKVAPQDVPIRASAGATSERPPLIVLKARAHAPGWLLGKSVHACKGRFRSLTHMLQASRTRISPGGCSRSTTARPGPPCAHPPLPGLPLCSPHPRTCAQLHSQPMLVPCPLSMLGQRALTPYSSMALTEKERIHCCHRWGQGPCRAARACTTRAFHPPPPPPPPGRPPAARLQLPRPRRRSRRPRRRCQARSRRRRPPSTATPSATPSQTVCNPRHTLPAAGVPSLFYNLAIVSMQKHAVLSILTAQVHAILLLGDILRGLLCIDRLVGLAVHRPAAAVGRDAGCSSPSRGGLCLCAHTARNPAAANAAAAQPWKAGGSCAAAGARRF